MHLQSLINAPLPKLYVEGSIPFARSNFLSRPAATGRVLFAGRLTAALKRLRFLASFCQIAAFVLIIPAHGILLVTAMQPQFILDVSLRRPAASKARMANLRRDSARRS
jgi:hypothetical protein